jgi:uncharacterized protein YqjF (DUF2071 family)
VLGSLQRLLSTKPIGAPIVSRHESLEHPAIVLATLPAALPERPAGWPIMHQTWTRLAFLHWPVEFELLRALLPARLQLQRFEGTAWVGVTPFSITGMRPSWLPPLPWVGRSLEINVRTYVVCDDVPGVWFLSLDASNPLAVWAARIAFHLPYYQARMQLDERSGHALFRSTRTHPHAPPAELDVEWQTGAPLPPLKPGTLEHFLIERYWLYSSDDRGLCRARIHHERWPLKHAGIAHLRSTMLAAHGLPEPSQPPLAHALARPLAVAVWPLKRV